MRVEQNKCLTVTSQVYERQPMIVVLSLLLTKFKQALAALGVYFPTRIVRLSQILLRLRKVWPEDFRLGQ